MKKYSSFSCIICIGQSIIEAEQQESVCKILTPPKVNFLGC